MSFNPDTVARHLNIHFDDALRLQQRVLLFPEIRQGYWSVLVMSKNRTGLLAKLFGVLALHNLNVLGAHIFTWPDETVVDVLNVVPGSSAEFSDQDWEALEKDMNQALNYRLDVGSRLRQKIQSPGYRPKRQVQQLRQEVIIDNTTSERFTVIEVYSGDRPGTLYNLTQTLADFGLDIHRARIATEVEQLIDIFYVSLRDGAKLEDQSRIDHLQEILLQVVEENDEIAA